MKYQWFLVNCCIKSTNVYMKYSVHNKIFLWVESLFWFVETYVSYLKFKQNQYLCLMRQRLEGFVMLGLWHKFKLAELTEIMRQKGDAVFMEIFNDIRVGVNVSIDFILKSRFVQKSERQYPYFALHMFCRK